MKIIKTYDMSSVETVSGQWGTLDFYSPEQDGVKTIVQVTLTLDQVKMLHRQLTSRIESANKEALEKAKQEFENADA